MERYLGAPLHSYNGRGILGNWGQAEPNRHCVDFVEAVNHPTLHHTSIIHVYEVFEHLHMLCKCIWVHPYTGMMVQGGDKFGKLGSGGAKMTLWCPLHRTSTIHAYEVFEHLYMLWKGIWVHPYTVITVEGGAKFWKIGVRRS